MNRTAEPAWLIVNADDYGYFRCVSRGIVECARAGLVTATGVFGNAPNLVEQAGWLGDCEELDTGVHLNLTHGAPLTKVMRDKLSRWSGQFPGKFALAAAVLSGAIGRKAVHDEWAAQIERCIQVGLQPRFLNSHEHIHMLPPLFPTACALAARFGIAHVRVTSVNTVQWSPPASLVRGVILRALRWAQPAALRSSAARFLGLEASGRLTLAQLERDLRTLQPGGIHELMCHPGRFDERELHDRRLLAYHDWEGERRLLTDPATATLLEHRGVRLIGYRHLDVRAGTLVVRPEAVVED